MEENILNYGSYSAYRETVETLSKHLHELLEYSYDLSLTNTAVSIRDTIDKVADEHFEVAIVGEFKRGKSTLINALLGQEILPADVLPATATLNRVTYNDTPYVSVEYKDGSTEKVPIDNLQDYVTKLTFESEQKAETVKEATVYYDTEFCKNNVDIIDTPGLNDDEQMTNVTLSILPEIDAAVFVISANSPFSQFEKEFLEKKMLSSDVGRIIFIVNCFGTFSKEDEDRIVDTVRTRIEKYVMDKAKKVMGENSKEFQVYQRKIGKPRVIGVYAKKALIAKMNGDKQALEESNFPQFEAVLENMLTKERGTISLQILANKIINSGTEVLNSVALRKNALMMENDEFMVRYKGAIEEIEEIRNKKRAEFVKINDAANTVYDGLRPLLDDYWTQIENCAMQVIETYQIFPNDLKKDKLKVVHGKIIDKIRENIETRAQLICEQIQNSINVALSDEAERLQSFEDEFFRNVEKIQQMFDINDRVNNSGRAVDQVIGSAIGASGIGALFIGFREAGIKGALLGFGTGAASFWTTCFAASAIAGGLTLLSPITLCIVAFAGLASTFTGKFAVDKFLANEKIEKYKSDFKTQVRKQLHEMKLNTDFSESVRKQVFNAFETLKDKIEEETEIILKDTQKTLNNLNQLKQEKKMVSEKEAERLQSVVAHTSNILSDAYILHKALSDEASEGEMADGENTEAAENAETAQA